MSEGFTYRDLGACWLGVVPWSPFGKPRLALNDQGQQDALSGEMAWFKDALMVGEAHRTSPSRSKARMTLRSHELGATKKFSASHMPAHWVENLARDSLKWTIKDGSPFLYSRKTAL